jgi:hypothetical protein
VFVKLSDYDKREAKVTSCCLSLLYAQASEQAVDHFSFAIPKYLGFGSKSARAFQGIARLRHLMFTVLRLRVPSLLPVPFFTRRRFVELDVLVTGCCGSHCITRLHR